MNYYNEIKIELINNEVTKKIKDYSKNKSDLNTYYKVGKLLSEAGKHYGEGIIKEYSNKLTEEFGKYISITTLKYIRQFYKFSKSHSVSDQLTFTHYKALFSIKEKEKVDFYIKLAINQNLSVRQLREKIKNNEYERLPDNAKSNLDKNKSKKITDYIKNPIVIKNNFNYENISENMLKKLILENIDDFLLELVNNFCYIRNEYKIKIGNNYNYIDILLYNIEFNCYCVVELKVTELKKEHIGQIEVYMNYIDKTIKTISQDKTIGIIICKKENKFIMEYCSDKRIINKEYILI